MGIKSKKIFPLINLKRSISAEFSQATLSSDVLKCCPDRLTAAVNQPKDTQTVDAALHRIGGGPFFPDEEDVFVAGYCRPQSSSRPYAY